MLDTSKLFSLQGRVALVTGGSRNLGKTIAKAYIAQGATVYISARLRGHRRRTGPKLSFVAPRRGYR